MDSRQGRGCLGLLAAFFTLAAAGGLGALMQAQGLKPPWTSAIAIGGLVAAVALGIAVFRRDPWAARVCGVAIVIAGVGIFVFGLAMFIRYLLTGEGAGGSTPFNFGLGLFVVTATGLGLAGGGAFLTRWRR